MERARQLLETGDMTVKEVAYALGYRHPNDFSGAFKHHARKRPSLTASQ